MAHLLGHGLCTEAARLERVFPAEGGGRSALRSVAQLEALLDLLALHHLPDPSGEPAQHIAWRAKLGALCETLRARAPAARAFVEAQLERGTAQSEDELASLRTERALLLHLEAALANYLDVPPAPPGYTGANTAEVGTS